MLGRTLRTISVLTAWLGVIYGPADLWGICGAYPTSCKWVAGLDRLQLLVVFSGLLVAWTIFRDWREPISAARRWWAGKRGLYSVKSHGIGRPDGLLEFYHPQVVVRFNKPIKKATIRLIVRSGIDSYRDKVSLVDEYDILDVRKDQEELTILGTIRATSSISGMQIVRSNWGRDPARDNPISGGSKNIVTLSINGRDHRLFLSIPPFHGTDFVILDQDEQWLRLLLGDTGSESPP